MNGSSSEDGAMADDDLNPPETDDGDLPPLELTMAEIAAEAKRLADRLQPVETQSKWQTVGIVLVLIVALTAGIIALENRRLTRSTEALTAQIKDCIDPSGQCYKDSRSRTGDVERRILQDQAKRAADQLEVVCDLFDEHRLERPSACGPDQPDAG